MSDYYHIWTNVIPMIDETYRAVPSLLTTTPTTGTVDPPPPSLPPSPVGLTVLTAPVYL